MTTALLAIALVITLCFLVLTRYRLNESKRTNVTLTKRFIDSSIRNGIMSIELQHLEDELKLIKKAVEHDNNYNDTTGNNSSDGNSNTTSTDM